MNRSPQEVAGGPEQPEHLVRLAAITRTWNWLGAVSSRAVNLPFVGASSARMMREVLTLLPEESEERSKLQQIEGTLSAFDGLDDDAKPSEVQAICVVLSSLYTPALLGLRLPPRSAQGELVIPNRRRRRRGRSGERGSNAEVEPDFQSTPSEPDVETSVDPADTSNQVAHADDATPAESGDSEPQSEAVTADLENDQDKKESDSEDAGEREFQRLLREAQKDTRRSRPDRPPGPRRLGFGHEAGTGRSLDVIKSLTPAQVEGLASTGIQNLGDLLMRLPVGFSHHHRADVESIDDSNPVVLRGTVQSRCTRWTSAGRRDEVVLSLSGEGTLVCRWLLQRPRGFTSWNHGAEIAVVGQVAQSEEEGLMILEAEPAGLDGRGSGSLPMYEQEGVDDRSFRRAMAEAVELVQGELKDWMPRNIQNKERLLNLDSALRDVHFPGNASGRGRERLAFDELFLLQLGVAWRARLGKSKGKAKGPRGFSHRANHQRLGQLSSQLGVRLTDEQELALDDIRRDLCRSSPMQRLLQGDVAAGKGRVAFFAAMMVAAAENQVAMVFNDAASAERAYVHAEPLLRALGVSSGLVSGAPNRGELDALRRGEFHVVYGTVELLGEEVAWRRLGLVVSMESTAIGMVMPGHLQSRDRRPDLLVVTRSLLPIRLVLMVYTAFELTTLKAPDTRGVQTFLLDSDERKNAYAQAATAVSEGQQIYVVFPVRDGKDLLSSQDAHRMADALRSEAFPSAAIGVYSSSMTRDERQRVFDDFVHRRIDVLVCTTFVEDGPEVENATIVMVEYADLHSCERLHRLRGHVSESRDGGRCYFVQSDSPEAAAKARLSQLLVERDGLALAELDLDGHGDRLASAEASGALPSLVCVDPRSNRGMMIRARDQAFQILQKDPELKFNSEMARMLNARWGEWLGELVPLVSQDRKSGNRGRGRNRRRRRR